MGRSRRPTPHAAVLLAVGVVASLTATMSAGSPSLADAGTQRTFTYEVRTLGTAADGEAFAATAAETLDDLRGWSLGGTVGFIRVPAGGDFTLWLAAASAMPSFGSPCDRNWSCSVGRNVAINEDRWFGASAAWNGGGGSLRDYRHMVVNHEVGHWLGFGHASCGGPGQPAPVMQQQSISLQGCAPNPWPLPGEREQVARRTGTSVLTGSPVGSVDTVTTSGFTVTVAGWAIDPDTTGPVAIHVYVDGIGAAITTADRIRPDVGAAFPRHGPAHGYATTVSLPSGPHWLCVYAIDAVAPGEPRAVGCAAAESGTPLGALDAVRTGPGTVTATGWAIDPDTARPIDVHAYLDGRGVPLRAADPRPDVAAALPGYGPNHGFTTTLPATAGAHTLCLYAINVDAAGRAGGSHPSLGCRTVNVGGAPFGALDAVRTGPGTVTATGWAIDPDTARPIDVHAYLDGRGVPLRAADPRPDVAAALPGYGPNHGFTTTLPATAGAHTLCLYAIDSGGGHNTTLGCAPAVVA